MNAADSISMSTAMWLFGGLLSLIYAMAVYFLGKMDSRIQRIEDKMEANAEANAKDHAAVVASLARVEQALVGMDRDITRHDREINALNRDIDDLRGREL